MRILAAVFLGMFIYGLLTAMYGVGLLSLGMFCLMLLAERRFAAQDKAYSADPRSARALGLSTNDALVKHDCECMRTKF